MFPDGRVLNRKGPGDIMIPTGEIVEVKSVPTSEATFVNGGDKPPRYRTIVVVTEGKEEDWYVLGEIQTDRWVRGRPTRLANAQICWYVPRDRIGCVREWRCDHD
jgi:hypothetical protein